MIDIQKNYEVFKQQPTEQNPFLVDSYPYGFKRTKAKFWVETTKRGDRTVFQTLNPKTQKWNKPKKSTYSPVLVVGIEKATGHFKRIVSLSHYSEEEFEQNLNLIKELVDFNELQKEKIRELKAFHKVMENVEFKCEVRKWRNKETGEITESVPIFEMGKYEEVGNEQGQADRERERKDREINQAINHEKEKLDKNEIQGF